MRLTKLELHGFKSFPDRTTFVFDRSITAILGPNGCGKSNVVDAIKWVLGEASAKNLRGKEMADVIFSGCGTRKPMHLAEVSLYFDNATRILPIPFNEVCITRRLYRSGQSEYLINRQPCLRRDIRELFFDTGVGTSAYSIIEQGRVEALLSAKPHERRLVFEEAAGVSKYKARRKEALARLGRSEQYLARVTDIVDEVDKNIRRVSRQAADARRHQRLKAELDATRASHALSQWRAWDAEIKRLRGELAELDMLLAREGDGAGEAAQRLTALANEEIDLAAAAKTAEDAVLEHQRRLGGIQNELTGTRTRLESIERESRDADGRVGGLRERIAGLQAEEEKAQAELEAARAEALRAEEAWAARERERGDSATRLAAAEQAIEDARREMLELVGRQSVLRADLARVDGAAEAAAARGGEYDRRREELAAAAEAAEAARAELRARLDAVAEAVSRANEAVAAARADGRAQQEEAERRRQEGQRLETERAAKQARRGALADLENSLSGTYAGVRAILEAKRAGNPEATEVIGMAVDLMQVPADVALAIETILGAQAQDLVVETFRGARAGVAFLKRQRAGRATFLPLDDLRPRQRLSRPMGHIRGVVGEAVDLIGFDPAHRRAMEYLLAGILVVDNIDTAHELSRTEARGVRIVTLEGDVINPSGAVTGGMGRDQRGGLVMRKAEMDALDAELAGLAEQAERVDAFRQKAEAAAAASRDALAGAEAALAAEIQRGAPVERELSVRESDAERLARELEQLDRERGEHAARAAQTAERRAAAAAELENLASAEREKTAALEARVGERDRLRSESEGLAEELAAGREARARAQAAAAEGERRVAAARREADERRAELDNCLGSGARAAFEREALEQKRAVLEKTEEEALRVRDGHEEERVRVRERLAEVRERLQAEREEEKGLALRMRKVEEAQNALRLSEQQFTLKLENIAQKAREELGIEDLGLLVEILDHRAAARRATEAAAARGEVVRPAAGASPSLSDNEDAADADADDADDGAALSVSAWDEAGRELAARAAESGEEYHPEAEAVAAAAGTVDDYVLPARYVGLPVPELPDLPFLADLEKSLASPGGEGDEGAEGAAVDVEAQIRDLAQRLARIGPVNACAIEELAELEARGEFLKSEQEDLQGAVGDLMNLIERLNDESQKRFNETFEAVRANFQAMFNRLFPGGTADLVLEEAPPATDGGDPLEAGIDIVARPPGKMAKSISLLSGGEKALCAVALLFAIFQSKPSPFCILDEVDGPLDESNIDNFMGQVREFSENTQFILISHNKFTMSKMDTVYGVTQEEQGVSRKLSLKVAQHAADAPATPDENPAAKAAEGSTPEAAGVAN